MTGVSTGQELCVGLSLAGFRDANATIHSKYFFLNVCLQRSASHFSTHALFVAFFSSILGGERGRLYVLVMAMVGYGSVLLLVSCASLRSN